MKKIKRTYWLLGFGCGIVLSGIIGAIMAVAMLHIKLYVTIVVTFAPSIPPITTAAIAIGASTHIIAPSAIISPSNGSTM